MTKKRAKTEKPKIEALKCTRCNVLREPESGYCRCGNPEYEVIYWCDFPCMATPGQQEFIAAPPYPWFGGKSSIASEIWARFGDVPNYVEPFFGGGAVWRLRPHWPFDDRITRRETINDFDGMVCNFWRAVQADPDAVAKYLDWPVNEIDLHSRGDWLFCRGESREFVERMRADPDYYDAKWAGWWCWFVANWIGGLPSTEAGGGKVATASMCIPDCRSWGTPERAYRGNCRTWGMANASRPMSRSAIGCKLWRIGFGACESAAAIGHVFAARP